MTNLIASKRVSAFVLFLLATLAVVVVSAATGARAQNGTGQTAPGTSTQPDAAQTQAAPEAAPADSTAAASDSTQPVEEFHERVMPVLPERPRVAVYDPGLPLMRKTLKNGVQLIVQEERTNSAAAAMVALRMGALYETDQYSGLSQVLMKSITAATKKLSPTELQIRMLANKMKLESGSSVDYGQVGFQTIRENVPASLELLAQIVLQPAFPDTSVESARSYFLAKASDDVERPIQESYARFLKTMYRGTPLARPPHGNVQSLSDARRADVLELYKKFFVGGNMVVAVVGNVDGKKTMAQLEKLFSAAPAGAPPKALPDTPKPLAADTVLTVYRPILGRALVYGYQAPGYADPDYPAFMILDSFLRSGDRSPITFWMPEREQVVDVGIVYPSYPHRSTMSVYVAVKPENYAAARDTLVAVFDRLKTEPLDKGEWGVQLKRVQNGFFSNQYEPVTRARNFSRWEVQGVTADFPRTFEAALLKLKPEDVRDAAARWLTHAAEVGQAPAGGQQVNGQP